MFPFVESHIKRIDESNLSSFSVFILRLMCQKQRYFPSKNVLPFLCMITLLSLSSSELPRRVTSDYVAEPQFVLHLPNGSERKSLLLAVLVVVLLVSVTAFYTRCWLPVALLYRDKFGRLEENGECISRK